MPWARACCLLHGHVYGPGFPSLQQLACTCADSQVNANTLRCPSLAPALLQILHTSVQFSLLPSDTCSAKQAPSALRANMQRPRSTASACVVQAQHGRTQPQACRMLRAEAYDNKQSEQMLCMRRRTLNIAHTVSTTHRATPACATTPSCFLEHQVILSQNIACFHFGQEMRCKTLS